MIKVMLAFYSGVAYTLGLAWITSLKSTSGLYSLNGRIDPTLFTYLLLTSSLIILLILLIREKVNK